MRILFVAYCMVDNYNGDSLIGVFKRCLRIGLEMKKRGHEVWISCTDHHLYADEMTRSAEGLIPFIDPRSWYSEDSELANRSKCRKIMADMNLDLVVIGEVPLAGTLLDSTICAVELGLRVVILDNAYNSITAEALCTQHGPIADGIVLTGLSSSQPANPPAHYCAVAPLIEQPSVGADSILQELGIVSDRLVTVLAYEKKAEELAIGILTALQEQECHSIFVSPDERRSWAALASLPRPLRSRARIISPPGDDALFGLLKSSRLVIGKCGFMQVTEALAVGAPFIGIYYQGCFRRELLQPDLLKFFHATDSVKPSRETIEVASRFLQLPEGSLAALHNGRFMALSQIARFLEELPQEVRSGTTDESVAAGYTRGMMQLALQSLHPNEAILILRVGCSRLRNTRWGAIDQLICRYRIRNVLKSVPLWGISLKADDEECLTEADIDKQKRSGRVLYRNPDGLRMIEEDTGQSHLPDLIV